MNNESYMLKEAAESPNAIAMQLEKNRPLWKEIVTRLQKIDMPLVMTVARGSSDHAATFAKYLFETQMGLVTASAAPSVNTLYQSRQKLKNALVIAISQSGESPDICEVISVAREQGAITLGLINQTQSTLAGLVEYVIPLWAGEEKAVAATKSYLAALAAILQGVSIASGNVYLQDALAHLPELLQKSLKMPWIDVDTGLQKANDLLVIGRGFGFSIAQEAALKCKEVAALHAEAFSSAEIHHGPLALVQSRLPILVFCQNDASFPDIIALTQKIRRLQGKVLLAIPENLKTNELEQTTILPLPASMHGFLDPLMGIQAFYQWIAKVAVLKGLNPDQPANLQKVTKTR